MSLTIRLLTFDKKLNSTAVPTLTGAPVYDNCYLLDDTDVINPAVRLVYQNNTFNPTVYNYAYIPAFSRYYFINTWHYDNRGWIANMSCDVLATYKTAIGTQNLYILRCASESDGDVIDNLYPAKTSCALDEIPLTNPWTYSVSGGCFVIGIISKDAKYGSIQYVAMDYTNFTTLCTALLQDSLLTNSGFSTSDATLALQKSIINPLQYIISTVFLPIPYSSIVGTSQSNLTVWDWTITGIANTAITLNPYSDNSANFTLSKHPATAARGNFVNASPFTRAELNFPPFGTIDLDTSITATKPYIYLRYSVDYITGVGTLKIYARETAASAEQALLADVSAQVGVPVQISQVDRNHLGVIGGLVQGAVGLFTGNFLGVAEGIGTAASSQIAHPKSSGTNGAFYQLQYTPACYMTFQDVVPDDNVDHGRPLMGFRTISLLSGYVMTDHAGITISGALRAELDQIVNFLESGFYYE